VTTEIKMLRTVPVSPNGLIVETWQAGSVHIVSDDLLRALINMGACEIATKAMAAAPENKAEPIKRKRGRPRKVQHD
jgi:hypothetical protein